MSSEGASALGAHLAEMDKLLRDIQVELAPEREPAPPLAPPAEPDPPRAATREPEPPPTATFTAPPTADAPQLQVLSELSARLLASIRELLAGYERVLVPAASPPRSARRAARNRSDSPDVTLAAGPFASVEALREFEQAVSRLPGVRDVAIRGYEGTDRAIIEVRLDQPNP
ncbi:MAG TPA: hypothetical protein VJU80_16435 [Solirubrobacteraceae bacterium]|nr:hypothetical protein [Solirubrobacteraceae bacterium]